MITVLKLATTLLRHTIGIRKFNNITINHFQNAQPSVLPDKWRFNTSQDWKLLADNFDSVSLDIILDDILQVLDFYLFLLSYLEEVVPQFIDVTNNSNLRIEPVDNSQSNRDFKNEKVRKKNKRAAKRKTKLNNLRAPMRVPAASSAALLLSCSALVSRPALVFHFRSLALLLSCPRSHTCLLSRSLPTIVPGSPAVLLPLLVLGLAPPHLAFTALKIFKLALSDEFLRHHLTSFAELLSPFPLLDLLPDKTDCKQTFDIAFINSCPLAGNHA